MNDAGKETERTSERNRLGGVATFVATGLGVGFFPIAPGTLGTVWGVLLAWGLQHLPPLTQIAGILVICLVGIPICGMAARRLGHKDPGSIVLDEIASLPIAFYAIDIVHATSVWKTVLAGFLLHRLFDIAKPPPARQLERLPGGLGIMADDWAAAVYANLALRLLIWLSVV